MATPVVTVAAGGLPVVDVTATKPLLGAAVTEAINGRGTAVTKVAGGGVPVTFSTVADYPGGAPVWQTTFSVSLTTNSPGWNGFNTRAIIPPASLALSGSQVRVTLLSSTIGGFTLDHMWIGHAAGAGDPYDFDGGQVPLTFSGGSAGVSTGPNTSVVSDPKVFSLNKTKTLIIATHFSSTSAVRHLATARDWYKSTPDETSVSDVTGYTFGVSYMISMIEVLA